MAEKSPAFQFYPKDFLTDAKVVMMTHTLRGIYITLLCHDWLEDGITRDLFESFTNINDGGKASTTLAECFGPHPKRVGYLTNPRLLKERQKQREWSEKSRLGGLSSAKSKGYSTKGGSVMVEECLQPNGNSSSSTPSSSSVINTPLPPKRGKKARIPKYTEFKSDDFPQEHPIALKAMQEWVEFKTKNGTPCLLDSYKAQMAEFTNTPALFAKLVARAKRNAWKGLNEQIPFEQTESGSNGFKTREQLEREDWERITAKQIEIGKKEGLL